MAPLVAELSAANTSTPCGDDAQHRELLDVLSLFIVPEYDLNIMQPGRVCIRWHPRR